MTQRVFPEYLKEVSETGDVRGGWPLPLGAHRQADGVNFALFSCHATGGQIEFFDDRDKGKPARVIELDPRRNRTSDVWHVWVRDVRPGQLYGYRIEGPYRPEEGHRFNSDKLLLDPLTEAVTYRDDVRRFWRGDRGMVGDFASRIAGSADLYEGSGKGPERSINYVTAHDGFTMNDLVSYDRKHNKANGEDNRDGTDTNYSENYGVEGETDDSEIQAIRRRQIKNFLLTLFVSRRVPMLLGGDEFRRTQKGNNNAYCQDNEISWYDWAKLELNEGIHRFTRGAGTSRPIPLHRHRTTSMNLGRKGGWTTQRRTRWGPGKARSSWL